MLQMTSFIGNPEAFPILRHWDFFNHAGVSPLPHSAAEAIRVYAGQAEQAAYLNSGWHFEIENLRQTSANLLNCHRDEIAFVKNTSEGISIVANGVDWQYGDQIVTTNVEYPANIYPWMEVSRSRGAKLVMVEEEDGPEGCRQTPIEKILEAASAPKTRLVALSHVEFASGQRHDIARIGKFCRERKILFCVDGIQSLGIIPVDVKEMNIDYLSADGHKWMLGPEGAGIFYCRRELLEHTRPMTIGWMNVVDAQNFGNYDFTLRADAGRFECGSFNVPGFLAFKAALDLLSGVGIEQISQRIKLLTDVLIAGLRKKGYRIISPRSEMQWSGIVSFVSPTHPHDKVVQMMRKEHRIELALREGRMRCSPHFYNTEAQIDRVVEKLPKHG
jgi:selenocysteine lyase/cysteine desulfurase